MIEAVIRMESADYSGNSEITSYIRALKSLKMKSAVKVLKKTVIALYKTNRKLR